GRRHCLSNDPHRFGRRCTRGPRRLPRRGRCTFADGSGAAPTPHGRGAAARSPRRAAAGGAPVAPPGGIDRTTQEEQAMRPLSKLLIAVPLACGVHVGCSSPAHAQLSVFDPANYSQNLLTAARALEQITNQVRQLQNQVLMLQRMDQNLMRLGSSISPDLQRTLGAIQIQLRAGEGIALRLQATQSGYGQLFPRQVSSSLSSDDVLRNAQSRWNEEYAAFRRAALLQGQIADSV